MMKDSELVKYYVETMEQALDPEDLIYRNRFTYKLPNIPYTEQKLKCLAMVVVVVTQVILILICVQNYQLLIKVEASPAMNKMVI